jgi:hypothetical protein
MPGAITAPQVANTEAALVPGVPGRTHVITPGGERLRVAAHYEPWHSGTAEETAEEQSGD